MIQHTKTKRLARLQRVLLMSVAAGVIGCGGGSDGDDGPPAPVATKLSGTAAVDAPVGGAAVQARCMGGEILETTTAANGTWTMDTTGNTLPCGIRVSGGGLAAGQALHSVALDFSNVNVTPLTDLMVAKAVGKLPSLWWGANGPSDFAVLGASNVDAALASLRAGFALPVLDTLDPRTTVFRAIPKDAMHDALQALQLALRNLGIDYAALVSEVANVGFGLSNGFRVSLSNAYTTVTVGDGGAGGGGDPQGPGTGNYTLTLNVVAAGVSTGPITIENVPKPATQAEFCSELTDPDSPTGLNQAIPPGQGKLTVNSCAFDGTVGKVSLTLAITSPVAFTVPYTVTYTYR